MISDQVRQGFPVATALEDRNPSFIAADAIQAGQLVLYVEAPLITDVCRILKNEFHFRLSGITALDWYPIEPRFEIVYLVHSIERNERIRLKVKLAGDNAEMESVVSVWAGANWYEREVFDLFGVKFRNHPNLIRIMMPEEWNGHPLRKDFPVHGYRYSYADESNVI